MGRVVNLLAALATLVRPGEVSDWDDEEAEACQYLSNSLVSKGKTDLFELSAIPASALYQARNAAMRPKAPPATMHPPWG